MVHSNVRRIHVDRNDVYAYEIAGQVSEEDMESMAKTLNPAFDSHPDKVDLLLWFKHYDGSESGSLWDTEVLKSRFKSITHINRYVVVGAPEQAQTIINVMGSIIPVDTHTFDAHEIDQAWALLDTRPTDNVGRQASRDTVSSEA